MFNSLAAQDLGPACSGLQQLPGSSSSSSQAHAKLQQDSMQFLQQTQPAAGQVMSFSLPCSSSDPSGSSFMSSFQPAGLSDRSASLVVKQESNSSSHTMSSTSSGITRELLMELMPSRKKGKGGRQPAQDPRLDPAIDPKRAKRILANRQSAARSKLKQKVLMDSLRSRQTVLAVQREAVTKELCHLSQKCAELEHDNQLIRCRVQALADQYRLKNTLTSKLATERDKLAHCKSQPTTSAAATPTSAPTFTMPMPCSQPPTSMAWAPTLTAPLLTSMEPPQPSSGACFPSLRLSAIPDCPQSLLAGFGGRQLQEGSIDARPQLCHSQQMVL